jgi:hypothetical protein
MVKPGYLTTEFGLTVLAQLLGLAVIFGVITADEATNVTVATAQLIAAATVFVSTVYPIIVYIKGRIAVKKAAEEAPEEA